MQVKLIRSTTKVNQARSKVGLPVPVTSRHTLLVGPPGCGKTTVARALTKQLCGLGVLRRPYGGRDQKSKLVGRHMGDAEKNTEAVLEGAMGGAVFVDEMHNLYETGYSGGDPVRHSDDRDAAAVSGEQSRRPGGVRRRLSKSDGTHAHRQSGSAPAVFDDDRVRVLHSR